MIRQSFLKFIFIGVVTTLFSFCVNSKPALQKVVLPVSEGWPPYFFRNNNGFYEGTDISLLSSVLTKMDYSLEFKEDIPIRRLTKYNKGLGFNANVSATFTEERALKYHYSIPYRVENIAVFYINLEFNKFASLEDLIVGSKIGTINLAGYYGKEFEILKSKYKQKLIHSETATRRIKLLMAGRVDYVIGDVKNMEFLLEKNNVTGVRQSSFFVNQQEVSMIFLKTEFDSKFMSNFNKLLKQKLSS